MTECNHLARDSIRDYLYKILNMYWQGIKYIIDTNMPKHFYYVRKADPIPEKEKIHKNLLSS